jgi:DNA-binding transcriptional regulator YiaG
MKADINHQLKPFIDEQRAKHPNQLTSGLNYLEVCRRQLRYKQPAMASLFDVHSSTYSAWERGIRYIPEPQLEKVLYRLNDIAHKMAVRDLWTGETAIALMRIKGMSFLDFAKLLGVKRQVVDIWNMEPYRVVNEGHSKLLSSLRNELINREK